MNIFAHAFELQPGMPEHAASVADGGAPLRQQLPHRDDDETIELLSTSSDEEEIEGHPKRSRLSGQQDELSRHEQQGQVQQLQQSALASQPRKQQADARQLPVLHPHAAIKNSHSMHHHQSCVLHPPPTDPIKDQGLTMVQTPADLATLFQHVRQARRFGFGLHFSASNNNREGNSSKHGEDGGPKLQGVAVSVEDGSSYYMPLPCSSKNGGNRAASTTGGGLHSSSRPYVNSIAEAGGDVERLWVMTKEGCLSDRPEDQMVQGLQVLLTDADMTKVSCMVKELCKRLEGQGSFNLSGPYVDAWLALYLTAPTTVSNMACTSIQDLEYQLSRRRGQSAVTDALQGLRFPSVSEQQTFASARLASGGKPSGGGQKVPVFLELSKGQQEALRTAAISRKMYDELYPVMRMEGLLSALADVEMPLVPILAGMETLGVCCDPRILVHQQQPALQRLSQLEAKAKMLTKRDFCLSSPKQTSEVLFQHLKLQPPSSCSRGKAGAFSTKNGVLKEMVGQHAVIGVILEHRRLAKNMGICGGWLDILRKCDSHVNRVVGSLEKSYKTQSNPGSTDLFCLPNGAKSSGTSSRQSEECITRVRGRFNQAGTATGRLAMDYPNLQTVPKPYEYELEVCGQEQNSKCKLELRSAFVAWPGHVLLAADYCQVELRLMAHFCGDEQLCRTMQGDVPDPFRPIAAMWQRCREEEVTQKQREQAKKITYAVLYGMGHNALAQDLQVDPHTAHRLVSSFMSSMPKLKSWMDRVLEDCRANGYITMLSGRRRYLPDIDSEDSALKSAAERQAINSMVQGSAADLIKSAMIQLDAQLRLQLNGIARLVLQVHDELLFEVKAGCQTQVAELVGRVMSNAWQLRMPTPVKMSMGPSWGELIELE